MEDVLSTTSHGELIPETAPMPVVPHQVQPLRPEEFYFSLFYAGTPAGSERWISQFDRGQYMIRREAQFQGSLGNSKRIQISRFVTGSRLPASFSENDNGRVFETIFDRSAGVVILRQNRDEASQALTQDHHDPLSVVQLLRDLDPNVENLRVPMVGGTVLITRLDDELIQTPWGEVLARAYYLRPGMGFIYIEAQAPHRPLKFVQAIGRYVLESSITNSIAKSGSGEFNRAPQPQKRSERPRGRHKPQAVGKPQVGGQGKPQSGGQGKPQSGGQAKPQSGGQAKPQKPQQPHKVNPVREAESDPKNKRRRRNRRRGKGGGAEE
jgi:hypothetical protein